MKKKNRYILVGHGGREGLSPKSLIEAGYAYNCS